METQLQKSFATENLNGKDEAIGCDAFVVSHFQLVFDNYIGKLLTVSELAIVLKVSERTIRDWVLDKQIPVTRINNLVRFEPLTISDWLTERSKNP